MRTTFRHVAAILAFAACTPTAPARPDLDAIATRYVVLALEMGHHDPAYVDAYYGPDSLKVQADADSLSLAQIRTSADSLIVILGDTVPAYDDSLVTMRHRYLRTQLGSMVARARMLEGTTLSFDQEAKALYDATPPHLSDAHFDSLLAELDTLVPGQGSLAARYQAFRTRVEIPNALVDTVFKTAIAACRERTLAHIALPAGEKFDLEYVTGTSWNAYNWYKGNSHSLIQVNMDFPIAVDRAIDLACHEGYPGHHVYNASLEKALVRDRDWVEFSVYPLFSPQSLIAEGSANFGIEMAFPGDERTAFERDVLFPLAGLDPALAEQNARIRDINTALNYARNEVARRYLDGDIDSTQAVAAMERYWLQSPAAGAKTLQFIKDYRSYVINYNLGRDLVADWVQREGGDDPTARWRAFASLLASPRLPSDLAAP
ncbi:MAG TPA: hypothetical protein VFN22_06305 [Gemmatimonadales bacterium]|nr:hypothetical protein [Gemmatimonadales bacterium]